MAADIEIPELSDPRAEVGGTVLADPDAQNAFRDTPAFEELEAEFRKIETGGPTSVDWKMLNGRTVDVLRSTSKDLVLATRLAYGLFLEEGYKGLAIGIKVLDDMVRDHWETMIPPVRRERGRAGAFDWLAEKLGPMVEAKKPEGPDGIFALQAHEFLLSLDTALEQKFTSSQAALGPLVRALRPIAKDVRSALEEEARRKAEAAAAAEAAEAHTAAPASPEAAEPMPAAQPAPQVAAPVVPPAPAPVPVAPSAPVPHAPAPEITVDGDLEAAFMAVFNAAGKLATNSRQQAPKDPRGYHCARFALWGRVIAPPPANGGKTALPPPQKNRLAELQALKGAGNHEGLVKSAEAAFVSSPFWLDAQHFICEAMTALGSDFEAARKLIEAELGSFVSRVPEVLGLSFSDGTPFASGETKAWIGQTVSSGGGGDYVADELASAASEAASLAQAGRVVDGLAILHAYCNRCRAERDWFRGQLKLAELCLRFDVLAPLVAQLARLRSISEERRLASWEPALVVEVARLSWQSLNHKNIRQVIADADVLHLKASVMETLSILDLTAAAELTGKR